MCNLPIPVCSLPYRRLFQRRGPPRRRILSNLSYSTLDSCDNFTVAGGLWNCKSATRKADFIPAYASLLSREFLALTETWITPENTTTPAALSSSFSSLRAQSSVPSSSLCTLGPLVLSSPRMACPTPPPLPESQPA